MEERKNCMFCPAYIYLRFGSKTEGGAMLLGKCHNCQADYIVSVDKYQAIHLMPKGDG